MDALYTKDSRNLTLDIKYFTIPRHLTPQSATQDSLDKRSVPYLGQISWPNFVLLTKFSIAENLLSD